MVDFYRMMCIKTIGPCTSSTPGETECSFVQGKMTLFTETGTEDSFDIRRYTSEQQDLARTSLCNEMSDGLSSLTSVHSAIKGLNCINTLGLSGTTRSGATPGNPTGSSQRLSSTNYVLIASCAVVIVVGLIVLKRKISQRGTDEGDNNSESSSVEEDMDDSGQNHSTSFGTTIVSGNMQGFDDTNPRTPNMSLNSTFSSPRNNMATIYSKGNESNMSYSTLESPRGISTFAKRSYYSSKDAPLVSSLEISSFSSADSSTVDYNDQAHLISDSQ